MANDERYGSLTNAKLSSASITVAPSCRCKTSVYLFLSHISCDTEKKTQWEW